MQPIHPGRYIFRKTELNADQGKEHFNFLPHLTYPQSLIKIRIYFKYMGSFSMNWKVYQEQMYQAENGWRP